jgi:hypothetical protein
MDCFSAIINYGLKPLAWSVSFNRQLAKLTVREMVMVSTVLALTLLLRLYGLEWGLPSPDRVHSYHPDEITVIGPTLHMNIFAGEMNPHFFNYGSLFLYAVYFARLLRRRLWLP